MADSAAIGKPVVRVSTRQWSGPARVATADSFQNLIARVGADPGSGNQSAGAQYGFNPVTRYRTELEFAYRGSWIVRVAVDAVADDMTRAGIELGSELTPDEGDLLMRGMVQMSIWSRLNQAIKWANLYGGAMVVPIIDGQNTKEPLRLDSIKEGQFKGLLVLDRWMVQPSTNDLVNAEDLSNGAAPEDLGLPRFYDVGVGLQGVGAPYSGMQIHHSRALRIDGLDLPWWQKMAENYWGLSVVEPLYDRLVAFDSTTQGAAQLVYKAHLRVWKVKDLSRLLGEDAATASLMEKRVDQVRKFQTNEGITVVDAEDDMTMSTYTFAGLSDMMLQFGQQVAGSLQIPLTRMFGQAPAGLNSTGESDTRNYYDGVHHKQELRLRRPVDVILGCMARTKGITLPKGFWWEFRNLWQMTDEQKAQTTDQVVTAVTQAKEAGIISVKIAAKELQQSSRVTGYFSNIDDDYIEQLDDAPPQLGEGMMPPGMGGMGGEPGMGRGDPFGADPTEPDRTDGNPKIPGSPNEEQEADDSVLPLHPRRRTHLHLHVGDRSRLLDFQGLPIYIEHWAGETRNGLRGWAVKMPASYGFIRETGSAESAGEGMDCFVGEDPDADRVWIINQVHPETGAFDEHKCMLGFATRTLAMRAYQRAFSDGSGVARIGGVKAMTMPDFKDWLDTADREMAA